MQGNKENDNNEDYSEEEETDPDDIVYESVCINSEEEREYLRYIMGHFNYETVLRYQASAEEF